MKRTCLVLLAAITAVFAPAALAAPTKITNCPKIITQPGLYEVQDNLDSVGTCIDVRADAVTIDLGGFRIRGNGTGVGITDATGGSRHGTTVRNGTVTNFLLAIQLANGSVDNVKVFDNVGVGISVVRGAVRNSHVQGNGGDGISVGGRSLVTDNVSIGNRTGISASQGSNIRGNTVGDNTHGGILTGGTGVAIANNTVFNNGNFGIGADCPSLLLANTVLFHGINVTLQGVNCTIESNATQ